MPGIVHITPWPLEQDGVSVFVRQMAEYAAGRCCEVHVIAPNKSLGSGRISGSLPAWFCGVSPDDESDGLRLLRGMIRFGQADIIHHHGPKTRWLFDGIDFARGNVVGTEHNWSGNLNPAYPWIVPICGPNAQIRIGVDLEKFRPAREMETGDLFHAGIVAQVYEPKIPDSFIDAIENEGDGLKIGVAGRTVHEHLAKRLEGSGRFTLYGELPHKLMPWFYNSIGALIVPSQFEAACLSAVEAMACGCPVIAMNHTGLAEIVEDAGILVDTEHELVRMAQVLAQDVGLRREISERCRAKAESVYDFKQTAAAFMKIYEERSGGAIKAGGDAA